MFDNFKKRTAVSLANKSANPQSVFFDSLKNIWSQNSPRKRNMTAEMLEEAKLSRIKFIFGERFGDPSGFTYYFVGNIDLALQKDSILKYLGGLPTVQREETWTDLGIRYPQHRIEKHFTREMETAKSTTYIGFFNTTKKYTIEDRLMLEMVKSYLSIRYFETLREEIGGTYGSSEWASISHYPAIQTQLGVFFDSDPAKTDTMVQVVYAEVEKMINEPLEEKIIKNTAENKIKEYKENRKKNNYWLNTLKSDDFNQEDYANFDYIKFWESITAKKVQKAAKKFLDMEKTVEVIQTAKQ
jgi:zinc protease